MKHSYSTGGVVINPEGKIMVVNQHGNSWSLPKGYINPGEDPLAAAKREIYEESGITDVEFVRELGTYQRHPINIDASGEDPTVMKTITIFLFRTDYAGSLKPLDPENPEARWVNPDEVAPLLTHPKDKEFFLSVKDQL